MTTQTVSVVSNSSDLYTPGASFGVLDLVYGVLLEAWPFGIVFDVAGQQARFVGKILVRDDGAMLKVERNGTYHWSGR